MKTYVWLLLLLTLAWPAGGITPIKLDPETMLSFSALDCDSPLNHIHTIPLARICKPNQKLVGSPKTVVGRVLETTEFTIISGFRCEKISSRMFFVCGMFSHTKISEPFQIERPDSHTDADCKNAGHRGLYKPDHLDGVYEPIEIGTTVYYNYIKIGRLFHSTNNVECQGAHNNGSDGGIPMDSIVEMVSTRFTVVKVDIKVSSKELLDLDRHTLLPNDCRVQSTCRSGHYVYYIPRLDVNCPYRLIREVEFQDLIVETQNGPKRTLVNKKHKLLFTLFEKIRVGPECTREFQVYRTQYSHLVLFVAENTEFGLQFGLPMLSGSDVDLELEFRVTLEFDLYNLESILKSKLIETGQHICSFNSKSLHQSEVSVFDNTSLIRIRGQVLQEISCTPVIVQAKIGDSTGKCYNRLIPVYYNGHRRFMSTDNVIYDDKHPSEIHEVNCDAQYLPIFVSLSQDLIIADPVVKILNMPISDQLLTKFQQQYIDSEIIHDTEESSLLYTDDEVQSYLNLVHFSRTQASVMDKFLNSYCRENSQCGDYQSSNSDQIFDIDKLSAYSPWNVFNKALQKISIIGNICSIVVCLILIFRVSKFMFIYVTKFLSYPTAWFAAFRNNSHGHRETVESFRLRGLSKSTPNLNSAEVTPIVPNPIYPRLSHDEPNISN